MIQIEYENEKTIQEQNADSTILEISNKNHIPHTQACGGNGRCSTCRIMVIEHPNNLMSPNEVESELIRKKGFEDNIRLACQAKATGNIKIRRLVRDEADIELALAESEVTTGKEKKLAILFSDIRNFTGFSEKQLPYDVIHHLNRYFFQMGESILQFGGYIDKYIGDGLMAVYGIEEDDAPKVCKQALLSGVMMLEELKIVNQYFQKNYNFSFDIGIGIHFGEAIIGEVGHPKKMQLTAIGDSVNLASRIESMCKKVKSNFLVSEQVYHYIQNDFEIGRKILAKLKGKSGQYCMYEIKGHKKAGQTHESGQDHDLRVETLHGFLSAKISSDMAPALLRLAFHDAGDYNSSEHSGGANGSIRFPESLQHSSNGGLSQWVDLVGKWRDEFNQTFEDEISWADMIAFSGALAIEKCGGLPVTLRLGRKDSDQPGDNDLLPTTDMNIDALLNYFQKMGFTVREFVALSGAHTLGKAEKLPFTEDLFSFNNSYFQRLVQKLVFSDNREDLVLLATDTALLNNDETKKIVFEYAHNNEKFLKEFNEAYIHMTELGQSFKS